MKIVALMPVKNEKWILQFTIPQLKRFADEILCLDAGSTDGTVEFLKSAGVSVKEQSEKKTNYSAWRQELLDWGRERGGTHFIWLDADEAFTTNFLGAENGQTKFRDRLATMKPGKKLAMQWLCLWKDAHVYRDDSSVWSNLYKDFIVCDDPNIKTGFDSTLLHEGRTPGPNTDPAGTVIWTKIPLDQGGVLHFQFVPFERFQIKQAYQRVRERAMNTASPQRINHKYSQTLDDPNARTKPIPQEWLAGIAGLDSIPRARDTYFLSGIFEFFRQKGILYFEPMQIWQIPQLHEQFVKEIGHQPRPKTYPKFIIRTKHAIDRVKGLIYNR